MLYLSRFLAILVVVEAQEARDTYRPPHPVEECQREDINYYSAHNTRRQSQRCGQNYHGALLGAVRLTTAKTLTAWHHVGAITGHVSNSPDTINSNIIWLYVRTL